MVSRWSSGPAGISVTQGLSERGLPSRLSVALLGLTATRTRTRDAAGCGEVGAGVVTVSTAGAASTVGVGVTVRERASTTTMAITRKATTAKSAPMTAARVRLRRGGGALTSTDGMVRDGGWVAGGRWTEREGLESPIGTRGGSSAGGLLLEPASWSCTTAWRFARSFWNRPDTHSPMARGLMRAVRPNRNASSAWRNSDAVPKRSSGRGARARSITAASSGSMLGFASTAAGTWPWLRVCMICRSDWSFHIRTPVAASQSITPTANRSARRSI